MEAKNDEQVVDEKKREAGEVDWDRPETLRTRSGLWVAAWFFLPLILCLVWGYLTR